MKCLFGTRLFTFRIKFCFHTLSRCQNQETLQYHPSESVLKSFKIEENIERAICTRGILGFGPMQWLESQCKTRNSETGFPDRYCLLMMFHKSISNSFLKLTKKSRQRVSIFFCIDICGLFLLLGYHDEKHSYSYSYTCVHHLTKIFIPFHIVKLCCILYNIVK